MTLEWRLKPHDRDRVQALSRDSGLHPLVAHLLSIGGSGTPGSAVTFMKARRDSLHDPEGLPGVIEAADRIVAAIRQGKKIAVYGDYDVDGACGTSILWTCLKLAGAVDPEYYIPHREDEGYGLNAEAIRHLARDRKADLIVTVDCGVTAVAEARLARELGVDLIVTDHHTPGPEWPGASVVVHPDAPGPAYPFPRLCGAAVAFKLSWQICKTFGDGKKASPHLRDFLLRSFNLVALATVADIMPLEGENRVFVRHGLRGDRRPRGVRGAEGAAGSLQPAGQGPPDAPATSGSTSAPGSTPPAASPTPRRPSACSPPTTPPRRWSWPANSTTATPSVAPSNAPSPSRPARWSRPTADWATAARSWSAIPIGTPA